MMVDAPFPVFVRDLLIKHEGVRSKVYPDKKGIPTVGIGFNLRRKDAPAMLEELGLVYGDVLNGRVTLSDQQIADLFNACMVQFLAEAERCVSNFGSLPYQIKAVVVDMLCCMGEHGFLGFHDFIPRLESERFVEAAHSMIASVWARREEPERARDDFNIIIAAVGPGGRGTKP
jgi:GH24 family phage-related lysozyme (muramidase)